MAHLLRGSASKFGPERACERLMSRQYGVLSRLQATDLGMTARMIEMRLASRAWVRVFPNVYASCAAPHSWHQRVMAAILWAGPGAVASHRTAAALWKLIPSSVIDITSTRRLRHPDVIMHRSPLPDKHVTMIGPIPVTNMHRTLIDLGGVVGEEPLETAVEEAIRLGRTSLAHLEKYLDQMKAKGRNGTAPMGRLLREADPRSGPSDSEFERLIARLIKKAGFPPFVKQHREYNNGIYVARIDIAYPHVPLAIEGHSFGFHGISKRAWLRDWERHNILSELNWKIIYVTPEDATQEPEKVIRRIARGLGM